MRSLRLLGRCGPFLMLVWLLSLGTALAQIPDLGTGRADLGAPCERGHASGGEHLGARENPGG